MFDDRWNILNPLVKSLPTYKVLSSKIVTWSLSPEVPLTSNLYPGDEVPIPTFSEESKVIPLSLITLPPPFCICNLLVELFKTIWA